MILNLTDDYRLESDSRCWMAQHRRVVQSGDNAGAVQWDTLGFYPKIGQAAIGLAEYDLRVSDATTLAEAMARVEKLATVLTDALTPHLDLEAK